MNEDKVISFTGFFKTMEDDEIAQDYIAEVDCHVNNTAPEGFVDVFNLLKYKSLQEDYDDIFPYFFYYEEDGVPWDGDYYGDLSFLIQDYPEYFTVDYAEIKDGSSVSDDDVNLNDLAFVSYFQMTIILYIAF